MSVFAVCFVWAVQYVDYKWNVESGAFVSSLFLYFFYIFSLFPKIAKARPAYNQREDGRGAERQFETAGTKLNFNFAAPISD